MKKIAIVIPNHKSEINNEEKISLDFAKKKFINYDKFFLVPDNLKLNFDTTGFQIKKIEPIYLSTYLKYSELLINKKFYKIFLNYDYILIYQLDCLFFSSENELEKFTFFDYVGSPYINIKKRKFSDIFNGGLSLRKVDACLSVLKSKKFNFFNLNLIQIKYFLSLRRFFHLIKFLSKILKIFLINNIFGRQNKNLSIIFFQNVSNYYIEDIFWSLFANIFKKDFKLPSFEKALSFGFCKDPEILFKLNKYKLPLGCHAWFKNNYKFWKKFL